MMTTPDSDTIISRLLTTMVDGLDISSEQYELAVRRYEDLARWLVDQGIGDSDVYPQGSFRLGTVLRPTVGHDFDVDLVFLRPLAKTSITQQQLREQAGKLLLAYTSERGAANGNPRLEEKGRCWALIYKRDAFHMDVLPVIPDEEVAEEAILLSDRDLREWQHSNPIGYADWFWTEMGEAEVAGRAHLAQMLKRDIEDVPQWLVRTTLQRVVQLLKLHRDFFFSKHPDDKPASILITTLATRAYGGDQDLHTAYRKVATMLQEHIELRDGKWWVPNPAHVEENFADKWNTNPDRKDHFDDWVKQLGDQSGQWNKPVGLNVTIEALTSAFGKPPVQAAVSSVGSIYAAASASGTLGVTAAGRITTSPSTRPVQRHDFYGE